jgi:hypothetical protein
MSTFNRLQIGLTGSVEPDNFTIEIYEWDVASSTEQLRRTVASSVTRTTSSTYNGGTLNGSNYGISGITGNDYYLKLTADNTCRSNATYYLGEIGLALSVHAQVPVTSNYGSANVLGTGFSGGFTTSFEWSNLASFDDVFYLADDAPTYPSVGYGSTFSSNFSFTHLGTYDSSDNPVSISSQWYSGLLDVALMTITQSQSSPYKTYYVSCPQTDQIAADGFGSIYHSQYRVTFNPSNTSRTFTVYWAGANI